MSDKKPMYKVTRPGFGKQFAVHKNWASVECEFDGAEEGERIEVTLQLMTEEEFSALPDFTGW